ncbi:MAG: NAD(+) synthase [Cyanobacteria bacterium SIG30]|nr:NAD(+) synthase [Cyanobacteria bacterium SIG30]
MRILIAQIDTIAGDIEYNFSKVKDAISYAKTNCANLVIFPEYTLSGFPFGDIFERHNSLFDIQDNILNEIKNLSTNLAIVIGYVGDSLESAFKVFSNSIELNAQSFELNGLNFCVESGLNSDLLKNNKIDVYLNCLSSPSRAGLIQERESCYSKFASENNLKLIHINQVGYSDSYVFDGASSIYNEIGKKVFCANSFEEGFYLVDNFEGKILETYFSKSFDDFSILNYEDDLERCFESIICGIRSYFSKNGFKKAVLGLSGGLDSTICACLLRYALGQDNVLAISMPSKITTSLSKNDAGELAKNLGIKYLELPIENVYKSFCSDFDNLFNDIDFERYQNSTTFENLQARSRATILWSVANEFKNTLTIATSDKSELYIGYATVNGDMSGGFAPIADVCKTKLFELGKYINKRFGDIIPLSILEKRPGAELKLDENGIPVCAEDENMPYHFLDEIIYLVENKGYGYFELLEHLFEYEKEHQISKSQKEEWIKKFYNKMNFSTFKWHLLPPSIINDYNSINSVEYYQPITSRIKFTK